VGTKAVIIRDVIIFQLKLVLDGLKDVVLSPIAVGAAVLDVLLPGERAGHRFYGVMRAGEGFERWLNLWGPARRADARQDGLFGASPAGADTLLGRLEEAVTGRREVPPVPRRSGE
jgi:hypothetical protein